MTDKKTMCMHCNQPADGTFNVVSKDYEFHITGGWFRLNITATQDSDESDGAFMDRCNDIAQEKAEEMAGNFLGDLEFEMK